MAPITNDSIRVATGHLGYHVPANSTQVSSEELMKKFRAKALPQKATTTTTTTPMRTGYKVPVDPNRASLPKGVIKADGSIDEKALERYIRSFGGSKTTTPQQTPKSQPVTVNYPEGQWKKIGGKWKKVVSETFIPATTPEEQRDLMNKWLNGVK